MGTSVKTRPKLCPCKRTCSPIWNSMAVDSRIKDEEADMNQGYSGECIGRMEPPVEFIYGGNLHRNEINHCHFTPLKGIIRYQECADDLWGSLILISRALDVLRPIQCTECGQCGRLSSHYWHLVPPESYREEMSPDEFNAAPRKVYCDGCAVRLGLLKWHDAERRYY